MKEKLATSYLIYPLHLTIEKNDDVWHAEKTQLEKIIPWCSNKRGNEDNSVVFFKDAKKLIRRVKSGTAETIQYLSN